MSKHTPGPWRPEARVPGEWRLARSVWTESGTTRICDVNDREIAGDGAGVEEFEANVHLIAAAPTMLSVLRELQERRGRSFIPSEDGFDERLAAAIALAEGK
jgi:hypothetical protein